MRLGKILSGCSIGLDDPFPQEVANRLPVLGLVRSKDVIEDAILTDDHDHMLYRGLGVSAALNVIMALFIHGNVGGEHHAYHRYPHREVHRGEKSGSDTNTA
jgi:hypothetical protein